MIGVFGTLDELIESLKAAGCNEVTFGRITEVDMDKEGQYPLAHITPVSTSLLERTAEVAYSVTVLDIVLDGAKTNLFTNDNELGKSNLADVLHNTAKISNKVWQQYLRNGNKYYVSGTTNELTPVLYEYKNVLAGYSFEFTYLVPNNEEGYC